MGLLDNQIHIGRETPYGTGTPTRSFEGYGDGHKRPPSYLESNGQRAGLQTIRSDRRRLVNMGAEGALEFDLTNKGLGMLFRAMFGSSTIAQQAATIAYLQTHATTGDGPSGESLVVQLGRPKIDGTVQAFTYLGGKADKWEISQKPGELGKLKLTMDYQDEQTAPALATAAYPSSTTPFGWVDCAVTVNSVAFDDLGFTVSGDNKLKKDRRYNRASALKKEPLRTGIPTYEGSLSSDFVDLTSYDLFRNGTIVPIVITWTGANIASTYFFTVKLTMAACEITGDTPEMSQSDTPRNGLPFTVLHDGTNPAVKLEYTSTDTAF